eukprot:s4018_g14.t1
MIRTTLENPLFEDARTRNYEEVPRDRPRNGFPRQFRERVGRRRQCRCIRGLEGRGDQTTETRVHKGPAAV